MSQRNKCRDCDKYEKEGHNYCRMCGFHVRKGFVKNVRIARIYHVNEKFCGYCGGQKHVCKCSN